MSEVDRGWLWNVRMACVASVLVISAPALVLQPVHLIQAWPFWLPYLLILLLVRGETLAMGLAWAVGTGLAALLVALARLLWTISAAPPAVRWTAVGYLAPFALAQALLVAGALMSFRGVRLEPAKRGALRLCFVLGVVSFLIPSAYSFWVEARSRTTLTDQAERERRAQEVSAAEGRAMYYLKKMRLCSEAYAAANPERGFPASHTMLGPEGANCIEPGLAMGQFAGYQFSYAAGEPDSAGKVSSYTITARPGGYGQPARASFFVDESGVVHVTRDDRAAAASDPPW